MNDVSIGQTLKRERDKRGLSLEDVQSHLRIHPRVLEHLERNNFDALPAQIYAKGFLKKYADFLGLNTSEILAQFDSLDIRKKEQRFVIGPDPGRRFHSSAAIADFMSRHRIMILRVLFFIAVVVVVWLFLRWASSFLERGAREMEPSRSSEERLSVPGTSAPTLRDNVFINSPSQNNFPSVRPDQALQISIQASTDAWIRLRTDNAVVFEAILKRGMTKEWTAKERIEIKVGRPQAVSFTLNNYKLGSPGGGKSTHVLITREGMKEIS